MTTPNTPRPQQWGNQQAPHGPSQPGQAFQSNLPNQPNPQQWIQPAAAAPAPQTSTATPSSLPSWPTWATIPLLLLTLVGSFLPNIGLDIDAFLFSMETKINWWGNLTFSSEVLGDFAQEIEEEVMSSSEVAVSTVLTASMTSLILFGYIAALITGFLKLNRVMSIIGLAAASLQMVAVIIATVLRAKIEAEIDGITEMDGITTASLTGGFWLWALTAVAAIAVYIFALVNSLSKKSGAAGSPLPPQSQQPMGFQPAQPEQYGGVAPQEQHFPPQTQPSNKPFA